jgi:hypothetical protein
MCNTLRLSSPCRLDWRNARYTHAQFSLEEVSITYMMLSLRDQGKQIQLMILISPFKNSFAHAAASTALPALKISPSLSSMHSLHLNSCRSTIECVGIFRAAVFDVNHRVCWGPLQTRKDTRRILEPLYNRRSSIQVPEIET